MEGNTVRFGKQFVNTKRGSIEFEKNIVEAGKDRGITIVRVKNIGRIDVNCILVTKIEKTVSTTKPSPLDNLAYSYLFPNPGSSQLELLNYNLVERLHIYSITGELVQSINEPAKNIYLARFKGT